MSELDELRAQKTAIEKRIKELTNKSIVCKNVKLEIAGDSCVLCVTRYSPSSAYRGNGKTRWEKIYYGNRDSAKQLIGELIDNLNNLKQKVDKDDF